MKKLSVLPKIYLAFMTVLTYLPIIVVVVYSFNGSRISSVWEGFSLKWYSELFADKAIFRSLLTSVALGLSASLISALLGTLAAVGMADARLPFKRAVEYIATLPMMIPEIVLGMVFLAFFSWIRLPFGPITLLISHVAFCIPYIYMQVSARIVGLDKSYLEAAYDLGAGESRAFFDITLPLIFPAIISGMFLAFAMSFDDVIISIFMTGVNTSTLPLKIYTQLKTGTTPKINALCTLMLAVTLICFAASFAFGRMGKKKSIKK